MTPHALAAYSADSKEMQIYRWSVETVQQSAF